MTTEELLEAMVIIIENHQPEDASTYIHRLWMNHADYEIKKGTVVHITKGLDISKRVPRD